MYCLLAAYEDQLTFLQSELAHVQGELKKCKKMSSAKTLEMERMKETLGKEITKETIEKVVQYVGMLPFPFLTCSLTVVVQIHYNECTTHTIILVYCKFENFRCQNIFKHGWKSKN